MQFKGTETGWKSYIHPEGALYFCDALLLRIISLLTQLYSQRITPEKLQHSQKKMHLGTYQARRAT